MSCCAGGVWYRTCDTHLELLHSLGEVKEQSKRSVNNKEMKCTERVNCDCGTYWLLSWRTNFNLIRVTAKLTLIIKGNGEHY